MPEPTWIEDLLEVRALDRREELERDARLACVEVLLRVRDERGRVARHRARADRVRAGRQPRLVLDVAAGRRVERERDELLRGGELVTGASSSGCRAPLGCQTVSCVSAASSAGIAKKPMSLTWPGVLLHVADDRAEHRVLRDGASASVLQRRSRSLPTRSPCSASPSWCDLRSVLEACRAPGWFAYFGLVGGVVRRPFRVLSPRCWRSRRGRRAGWSRCRRRSARPG